LKKALITGITGQDGSYLAELLLAKGYEVWGMVRRSSAAGAMDRIRHLIGHEGAEGDVRLIGGDLTDAGRLAEIVKTIQPDEVYNLAAQSHVRLSFDEPLYTVDTVANGALRLLEAIRLHAPQARFYQASSSEMYGKARAVPQNEDTPFHPRSPYAVGKVYAFWQTVNYREAYGMYACNGILFNHESPRRGENFVTRKITLAVGRIREGLQDKLYLGNLDARRDWGFAGDYVDAMWRMLQQDEPEDFVIATGETHTVQEFVEVAFGRAGLDWRDHVETDPRFLRPSEVDLLLGDATRAHEKLGWKPKYTFRGLVEMMVDADLELARWEKSHGQPPSPEARSGPGAIRRG